MKDASYQVSFTDFPELTRTYNSRSLHTGYFGFGWCSNIEKSLIIKSPRDIILKDCDLESPFVLTDENILLKTRTFENPLTLEKILFKTGSYTLYLKTGEIRIFNRKGQTTLVIQPGGQKMAFQYIGNTLESIHTHDGKNLKFQVNDTNQVFKIESGGGRGPSSIYLYEKENLIQSVDSLQSSHLYEYDKLNNIVKLTYPDKTHEYITYNNDHDRVIKMELRNKCQEYYDFFTENKDPLHQISTLTRKCDNKTIHQYIYEFWYKTRSDGLRYLERYKINQSKQTLDITYHPYDGNPVRIIKNGKNLITQI